MAISGRALALACALSVSLVAASRARGGDLDEFGFGTRPSAMGGAFTALASDWTATWYNPAGLTGSRHVNVGLGFQYANFDLDFKSARGSSDTDNKARRVDPLSAFTLGTSTTIALDDPDRLAFGVGLFLPTRKIVEASGRTPSSTPDWTLYGTNSDRLSVLPAVAVKIIDGLSIGAGANIFAVTEGSEQITATLNSPIAADFSLKLKPDLGGVFGIFFQPASSISFGVCYRTERSFKVDLPVNVNVQGIQLPFKTQYLTFFDPHTVSIGVAWNVLDGPILVALDVSYLNWSAYRDPFLVLSSGTFPVPRNVHSGFDDIFTVRVGVEWQVMDWLAIRGGYFYRPSPAPDPTGPATLLDCDKHVFTLGAGFTWVPKKNEPAPDDKKPDAKDAKDAKEKPRAPVMDVSIDFDVFFQYQLFIERSARRSDPTDPLGDITFGGGVWNLGAGIGARF